MHQHQLVHTIGSCISENHTGVITHWINCGRPVSCKDDIKDLPKYAEDFENWYKACAPGWRRDRGIGIRLTRESGQDWSELERFGPNGIVSFVVGLAWWKKAVERLPCTTHRERQHKLLQHGLYEGAQDEVAYTFKCLREASR